MCQADIQDAISFIAQDEDITVLVHDQKEKLKKDNEHATVSHVYHKQRMKKDGIVSRDSRYLFLIQVFRIACRQVRDLLLMRSQRQGLREEGFQP